MLQQHVILQFQHLDRDCFNRENNGDEMDNN